MTLQGGFDERDGQGHVSLSAPLSAQQAQDVCRALSGATLHLGDGGQVKNHISAAARLRGR